LPGRRRRCVQQLLLWLFGGAAFDHQQRAAELCRQRGTCQASARTDPLDAGPARILQSGNLGAMSTPPYPTAGTKNDSTSVTLPALAKMKADGRKIAMLTAYDASLAAAADRAGVDVLLVGDSLGMVIQGHPSTLPVSLDDVLYHTRCVAAARTRALLIAD